MKTLLNTEAPDFSLSDQDNVVRSLHDWNGQYVLLYFYPKDMTPGCTIEAKGFRDAMTQLVDAGVQVIGISVDSCESHKHFAQKHQLNFPLLADTEKQVVTQYGVWTEKSLFGKKYMGIERESFLIDPKGMIIKHYDKVIPTSHPAEVLKDVQAFKAAV